jgi:hypothetical protein
VKAETDTELFRDPRSLVSDGARAKQLHRQHLAQILTGQHGADDESEVIDQAAYEAFVNDVAEAVLRRLERPSQ